MIQFDYIMFFSNGFFNHQLAGVSADRFDASTEFFFSERLERIEFGDSLLARQSLLVRSCKERLKTGNEI